MDGAVAHESGRRAWAELRVILDVYITTCMVDISLSNDGKFEITHE